MNRVQVVQRCVDRTRGRIYLEIGVKRGRCFSKIRARRKIAVDPGLALSKRRERAAARDPAVYRFAQTSDDFFDQNEALLDATGVSVAFIDGLHTYEQALRDIENASTYLHADGFVVVHDCNPKLAWLARPAGSFTEFRQTGHWWELAWCGDVWKAIVHLRSLRDDLEVTVLDCDFGVGLIKRGTPKTNLAYSPDHIAQMSYRDLARERKELLNLKQPRLLQSLLT